MARKTALYQVHLEHKAKLINFSGCYLPLHYGSALGEHQSVRDIAGMFDVSHLQLLDVCGSGATHWLRIMMSNDVAKLSDGMGMYTCLCKENGGVVDDMMVFRISENHYRLSIDSARREKDLAWMNARLTRDVEIVEVSGLSTIAVQGPDAVKLISAACDSSSLSRQLYSMPRHSITIMNDWSISRMGFTGEDGLEITLPDSHAAGLWQALSDQGIAPAGLGARNTLRLEAGFSLYGQDIDGRHSPAESGVAHTIDISDEDRQFAGRKVLEDHKLFGGRKFQIGLVLEGKGLLRRGARVELVGESIGSISSGCYSPKRAASIGLARVSRKFEGRCDVEVDGHLQPAHVTSLPFVPHGLARE